MESGRNTEFRHPLIPSFQRIPASRCFVVDKPTLRDDLEDEGDDRLAFGVDLVRRQATMCLILATDFRT